MPQQVKVYRELQFLRAGKRVVFTNNATGNVDIKDKSGNIIATIDADLRDLIFPSGSLLDLSAAIGTLSLAAGEIATADIADAAVTPPKTKIKSVVALGDAAATLTAAQMIDSGIFTITPTAARALTVDTAANLVAAMPGYQVGTWFDIVIVNLAALDVTLTTNTGITLVGKMVVNNVSGTWRVRFDSATAVTIYRM